MKQRFAVGGRQCPGGDGAIDQNLEIDLMVGGVHAGRIVDRVGVDTAAGQRIGDAAALGDAEIGALADDFGADFIAVDAQRVVGPVAGFGVAFVRRLDVSADAAEPQQVDRGCEHFADQLGRSQPVGLDAEKRASSAG